MVYKSIATGIAKLKPKRLYKKVIETSAEAKTLLKEAQE